MLRSATDAKNLAERSGACLLASPSLTVLKPNLALVEALTTAMQIGGVGLQARAEE